MKKALPLFYLGHPAHYHLFKGVINHFFEVGQAPVVVIKEKDVLEELTRKESWPVVVLKGNPIGSSFRVRIQNVKRLMRLFFICLRSGANLLVGSAAELAIIGKVLGRKSVVFFEDDFEEIPLFAKIAGPNASILVCPTSCSAGDWESRSLKYPSYQELAYLHPNHFKADRSKVPQSIDLDRPFFLIRFSALNAYHDEGKSGITDDLAQEIMDRLEPYGEVLITSERPLSEKLEKYRINISPEHIHHVMYYASLFVGDSQTMTAECAVLGTPSIRYNDFVGKLGYLEELEHRFQLTKGIKVGETTELLKEIEMKTELFKAGTPLKLNTNELLGQMMDMNEFLIWLLPNYPESAGEIKSGGVSFSRFIKS